MLQTQFNLHVRQLPFLQKNTLHLAAVSGGVDSVVLCHLLRGAGFSFAIAHCNFQLRGDESRRDEAFVRSLAEGLNVPLFVQHFETQDYASSHKVSIQVAARELRYDWFRHLLEGAPHGEIAFGKDSCIITAHHADDNIETVLMNFFRGTGLKGLTGMDALFRRIARPLLPFRKVDLLAYADAHQLLFVEDSSNANSYYTRNYFRNEMLPALKTVFPQVEENIMGNIERLKDVSTIYNKAINEALVKLVERRGAELHFPILKLLKMPGYRAVLWEIIKENDFTAAQIDEVVKLMEASNGSFVESASHRIIRNRAWLIIAPKRATSETIHVVIDASTDSVSFAEGDIQITHTDKPENWLPTGDAMVAEMDAADVAFPLLLRRSRQGDYFYPLGMYKKKKVSRFLIDQKLSAVEKERVWVIESNKRIVWIVGRRMDDRFKVKTGTTKLLRLQLHPGKP